MLTGSSMKPKWVSDCNLNVNSFGMRIFVFFFLMLSLLASCASHNTDPKVVKSELIDMWDNGKPKKAWLYAEIDGQLEAVREVNYYSDGAKQLEGPLLNGKRDGVWKSYYEDGNLWSVGHYTNGIRQGKAVVYYPNGNMMYKGQYTNDRRSGLWRTWDEQGKLVREVILE